MAKTGSGWGATTPSFLTGHGVAGKSSTPKWGPANRFARTTSSTSITADAPIRTALITHAATPRSSRNGFVSLEDHFGGGTIESKPFTFDGDTLRVNVASPHGALRVEVLDHGGDPVPGFRRDDCLPIDADRVDATVRWQDNASIEALAGKPIRLKFYLQKARLFAFWIE